VPPRLHHRIIQSTPLAAGAWGSGALSGGYVFTFSGAWACTTRSFTLAMPAGLKYNTAYRLRVQYNENYAGANQGQYLRMGARMKPGVSLPQLNAELKLAGVILCMYDAGTRLAAEVAQDLETFFANARGQPTPWADARLFQTRIRRNIRLAEAPSFGQSIFQYAADSHGAEDYRKLAEEIVANGSPVVSV